MISAMEANAIANRQTSEQHKGEIVKIEEAVKKAMSEGKTNCTVYFYCKTTVQFELEGLGYKVSPGSCQREGSWTHIYWENV